MKCRTDFVTNSSSSAFIFEKGQDYKRLFQKEELAGVEKRIKKISELELFSQSDIFLWFGINEYMKQKEKKETEDTALFLFTVLAYFSSWDYYEDKAIYLKENGEIKYEEIKRSILAEKLPELSDYNVCKETFKEAMVILEDCITKRAEELLNYMEYLREKDVSYGALLEQYFGCEDVIYTCGYDLDYDIVSALGDLWEKEKIRWLIYHA